MINSISNKENFEKATGVKSSNILIEEKIEVTYRLIDENMKENLLEDMDKKGFKIKSLIGDIVVFEKIMKNTEGTYI